MKIRMKKIVPINVYEVNMTVFISEKRPEILPIIQAVREANEKGKPAVKYLSEVLFIGFPLKFSENIFEELRLLELVNENGELTPRGLEALATSNIMEPDKGSFQIKVVNDSLIPNSIIAVDQLDPNARKEIFSSKEKREESKIQIPKYIVSQKGKRFKTLDEVQSLVDIQDIAPRGSIDRRTKEILEYYLYFEGNDWKAEVRFQNKSFSQELPESFDGTELIKSLLFSIHKNVDISTWRVPQKPSSLTTKELLNFSKDFQLKKVEIQNIGIFDILTLRDVSICPEDNKTAKEWAMKIFTETLSNYLVEIEYLEKWGEIIDQNNELKKFQIEIPSMNEVLSNLDPGSKKYWFLQAPFDLKLNELIIND